MSAPFGYDFLPEMSPGGFQSKSIRNFQSRRQKAFQQNLLNRHGSILDRREACRNRGATWRERNQPKYSLGHYSQHSFRAHEETDQVETRLIFMRPTAYSHDCSVG